MASLNKATIIGNLGKDPDILTTQSGKKVARFSVACSETWLDKQTGERNQKTEWINVVVFNESIVGVIEKYVKKGSKIYIEGAIATRKWTDKSGVERYITEVVLQGFNSKVILLDSKSEAIDTPPSAHNQAKQNAYVEEELDDEIPY